MVSRGFSTGCTHPPAAAPTRFIGSLWRMAATLATLAVLLPSAGCGGGGGGGPALGLPVPIVLPPPQPQVVDGSVSATVNPAVVSVESVDGQTTDATTTFKVSLNYTGNRNIYLALDEDASLGSRSIFVIKQPTLDVSTTLPTTRPVGAHDGALTLRVCFDTQCTQPVSGSPLRLPLRLTVKPNLQVEPTVSLARAGREPAPQRDVPVVVPPEAGSLVLDNVAGASINATWTGSAIRLTTQQLIPGVYTSEYVLRSITDARYSARLKATYTVQAAPEGYVGLALRVVSSDSTHVAEGQPFRAVFRVQRPNFTDSYQPPVIVLGDDRATLHDLGNDTHELRINTLGLAPDAFYSATVQVAAQPTGGTETLFWSLRVGPAFGLGSLSVTLDRHSTAASLRASAPVVMPSGPAQRWTARSSVPWARLVNSSGIAGVDPVELDYDAATVLAQYGPLFGELEVSIDRAGTTPITVPFAVNNLVPELGPALSAALVGTEGYLYLDGKLGLNTVTPSNLQLSGARLVDVAWLSDSRFVGDIGVLRVRVDQAVAGSPLVLRYATPLKTTEVQIPVQAPVRTAPGYASLPYKAWRSPRWALRHNALYFGAQDTLARWSLQGGSWSLTSTALPGLIDASLYGDERMLLGAASTELWRIDPASLAVTARTPLNSGFVTGQMLEPRPPAASSALVVAVDGASVGAIRLQGSPSTAGLVGLGGQMAPLTGSGANGNDPGHYPTSATDGSERSAPAIVRSANGEAVVGALPNGAIRWYTASRRRPMAPATLPEGSLLRGVSDDGLRLLLDDGRMAWLGDAVNSTSGLTFSAEQVMVPGSLAALVPADRTLGGLGLSSNGSHALLYIYRVATESGAPRARDAELWLVRLGAMPTESLNNAVVTERLPLPDAVGCTAPLISGEPCAHAAAVIVAPGDASAFVLGPRGVAALPLPALTGSAASRAPGLKQPAAASAQPTMQTWRPASPPR